MDSFEKNTMEEGVNSSKRVTIEKATIFISLLGLFVSLILVQMNKKASIELEEKRIESELFLKAIEISNKETTLDNLKFLLKMGAISEKRAKVIESLSDSIYSKKHNNIYTASDTVGFLDFYVLNTKKDIRLYDKIIRGAYIQIESLDSINALKICGYTDNVYGRIEFYFPKYYSGKFVKVTIEKERFKTKLFELKLPEFENIMDTRKEVFLEEE